MGGGEVGARYSEAREEPQGKIVVYFLKSWLACYFFPASTLFT
jgi:hypothetical protein